MKKAIVLNGKYQGRVGYVDLAPVKYGNVMFYSKEGEFPYRVCLKQDDVKIIKGERDDR